MTRIRWTIEAADQLESTVNRIRDDNAEAARRVTRIVFDRIAELRKFPSIGRPGEQKGTRELVCPPFVIVYRLHENVAEILYIWHGAQDWRANCCDRLDESKKAPERQKKFALIPVDQFRRLIGDAMVLDESVDMAVGDRTPPRPAGR